MRIRRDSASRIPLEPEKLSPSPRFPVRSSPSRYVELDVRSNFSFLQGASPPEEIVRRAAELGYDAVALADRDGLYGMVRAHEEAERQGVRLVVGCALTVEGEPREAIEPGVSAAMSELPTLLVYVENHTGYTNLCRILTKSHDRHTKGKPRATQEGVPRNCFAGIDLDDVAAHAEGLWALAPASLGDAALAKVHEAFGERASLAVHKHLLGRDRALVRRALEASGRFGLPVAATNAVRYARREGKLVFDVLYCIREGTTLDRAGRALTPNAEARLKDETEMMRLFAGKEAWLTRTLDVASACRFKMDELDYSFPCELEAPAFPGETADEALRRLTYEGAKERYPDGLPDAIAAQIEKEIALVEKLEVAPYFLSVQSIVRIARARDILCQGRGSAANSAVCYCLGITAVDPARSNLLFERFLSAERREPPDIDVDFEHERREEVIQELYKRYGRERAAMVSEVICYRGRSALREVGKVFGLSLEQVDRLSTLVHWWDGVHDVGAERLKEAGFDAGDGRVQQVLALADAIQGFPRHLSIHVGGFVLSAEPLDRVAPVEPATMPERTVIPWDKDDIDTLGFFKVDVLGLGMLTAIRKTLAFIQHDPRVSAKTAIDQLAKIPPEDPDVYEALCHADTVGVFQIESRAQMAMLPRLRPKKFYDLVIEVAIVRPGPIQGGMVHPYLRRRNGEETLEAPHPALAPILERTLGVPLFQEQVMEIAIVGAGYTGGEADCLRRDMAAWRKNGNLERHRDRLHKGFAERGISAKFAEQLYAQIQGFGEYGFPESHAASFALLVYASSWLKVYHPAAFAAALVNSQPMGFYSPSTILRDAQKHGVPVRSVDVMKSFWDCTLETVRGSAPVRACAADGPRRRSPRHPPPAYWSEGCAIRVGLRQVQGLGEEAGKRIEATRGDRAFDSVEDLAARAGLTRGELTALAEAGALEALAPGRREAIWKTRAPHIGSADLFAGAREDEAPVGLAPLTRVERLALDYERTGLSVDDHPMLLLRPTLPKRYVRASELALMPQGRRASAAGMVICRQRPMTASGVVFVTMEDETGFINLILYTRVFERFHHVATTSTLLLAHGVVEREGEVIYIIVDRLEPLALRDSGRPVDCVSMSRDFH